MEAATLSLIADRLSSIDRKIETQENRSSDSRRKIYDKVETIQTIQQDMQGSQTELMHRLARVESKIEEMSPTVSAVIDVQRNVEAAGKAGAVLWKIGAWLLGAAASAAVGWSWFWNNFSLK